MHDQKTDQDLMSEYVRVTLTVFALTDWFSNGPVDLVPESEAGKAVQAIREWRDLHAELHAEMKKRGIL